MKCRRFRRIMFLSVGIVLIPLVAWCLVVAAAPTDWARLHLVSILERRSGRSVGLESLSMCFSGGVDLVNLKIGAPGGLADPWLETHRVHLNVNPLRFVFGGLDATDLEIIGARLRVQRRADGSLELADLVKSPNTSKPGASESRSGASLRFRLQDAQILLVDEPTRSSVTLEHVDGDGTWEDGKAVTANLYGFVNGGPFQLAGTVDRTPGRPSFEGSFNADQVRLDGGMAVLRYLVPVLAGASSKVGGMLTIQMYLRGEGETVARLRETLLGQGRITIDPIDLEKIELLEDLEKAVTLPGRSRIATLNTDFTVKQGRVTTRRLALQMAKTPLVITGWTDFDGRLDYQMGLEGLADRVPDRARRLLSRLEVDLDALSTLRLSGTVDELTVNITPRTAGPTSAVDGALEKRDVQRLRLIGQELRDKLLR